MPNSIVHVLLTPNCLGQITIPIYYSHGLHALRLLTRERGNTETETDRQTETDADRDMQRQTETDTGRDSQTDRGRGRE